MLKTVFLKLSTIMERPLLRILQANSPDFDSVAKYYSGQLLQFVKQVLYIIPVNIFRQLDAISKILSTSVKELEIRISKDTLKDAAQTEQRYILAEKTHKITVFTEGMLDLDNVMMGVIEISSESKFGVQPKDILIDGLKKELCKTIAKMLHEEFIFTEPVGTVKTGIDHSKQGAMGSFGDYEVKFARLRANFVGLKRSIEYIQDFLNVQGEKIWREELTRIVDFAVEKEAITLVNKKYNANIEDEKNYIPEFDPVDEFDATFMGRLLRHILASMDRGFYLDHLSTWYDFEGQQTFGLRFINFLHDTLGTVFLQGLDKLLVYNIVFQLRSFYKNYGYIIGGGDITPEMKKKFEKKEAAFLVKDIREVHGFINGNFENLNEQHLTNYNKIQKQIPVFQEFLMPYILTIGKL